MRIVNEYLNKFHLLHQPHKWFSAFLISPIHFLELRYKNKYHLNFQHAKKLFVFDISLLLSIIFLTCATAFWFLYNPTITNLILLSIKPSSTKIISGDYVTYTTTYQNKSDIKIISPVLIINLPAGFIVDKTEPSEQFNSPENKFTLTDLLPNQQNIVTISGWFYGTPGAENKITATLEYTQEGRQNKETKSTPIFQFHRGSVLNAEITAPDKLIAGGTMPISITLTNNGAIPLNAIELPLTLPTGLSLTELTASAGTIENNQWKIEKLDAKESVGLSALLKTVAPGQIKIVTLKLTPSLKIKDVLIPQSTLEHKFAILHPQLTGQLYWTDETRKIQPGQTLELNLSIANTGDVDLKNLEVEIPVPAEVIDAGKLAILNNGSYKNNAWTVSHKQDAGLLTLPKNQMTNFKIKFPILKSPSGDTDLILRLNSKFIAEIQDAGNALYQTNATAPEIKIGTQLNLAGEIRYYTADGDQLGRGPLPPQVNKETKYWALLKVANATSKVTNLILTGKLPENVAWTGKSSVSHGSGIVFNEKTKTISWSLNSLLPRQTAGIYFELALTPTAEQTGTTPIILKNIQLQATDDFIKEKITRALPDLDVSLTDDLIGREKGVNVIGDK